MTTVEFLPTYHARNMKNIAQLGDKTKEAALKVYAEAIKEKINILFHSTIRTVEEQKKNVASGASKTMKSYHLVGQAFDVVMIDGVEANWTSGYKSPKFIKFIAIAKKNGFTWGGDWDNDGSSRDETFIDSPHFQLSTTLKYGKDTFETKGKAELPKPKPAPPKPVAPAPAKPVVKAAPKKRIVQKYDSVVDYLVANKKPHDFVSRVKLAKKLGIPHYNGSADQNNHMLRLLEDSD